MLGLVPDEPYLYDKLSGREFLEFVTDMHGLDERSAQRIRREIRNFELAAFVEDRSETYSHGMRQRLAFAAAPGIGSGRVGLGRANGRARPAACGC